MKRWMFAALLVGSAVLSYEQPAGTSGAYSGLVGNCPGATPDDESWDNWAINDCLAAQDEVILDEGAYLIAGTLNLVRPGSRLVGVSNGAVLQATSGLYGRILEANWVDGFTIENIRFYGNKGERAWRLWECYVANNNRDFAKNVLLRGNGFTVASVTSADALCGSAMEVEGSGYTIRNSRFLFNGFESGGPDPWADGLTVWSCNNGAIHDNEFWDNTDVDLVIGGGTGCQVYNNAISHNSSYGFAGIHVGWFPPGGGNHNGNTYSGNWVSSAYNKLSYGIVTGFHPWDPAVGVPHGGSLVSNFAEGAVNNLTVDGIGDGTVQSNGWGAIQGNKQYPPSCQLPGAHYTAFDFGIASLQNGYISRFYHNTSCG